jgi:DNA-binding response OmpR family regulator
LISNDKIEVFSAITAKKALAVLKKELFDCIVLDYVLPDANGMELLNKVNLLKAAANNDPIAFGPRLYPG